jgi:hypothetical protein
VLADEAYSGAPTRYVFDGEYWGIQAVVNNTSFTQAQMDALNSGVTAYGWESLQSAVAGKQATIASPTSGALAGMTPAQCLQYISELLGGTHKDIGLDINSVNVA